VGVAGLECGCRERKTKENHPGKLGCTQRESGRHETESRSRSHMCWFLVCWGFVGEKVGLFWFWVVFGVDFFLIVVWFGFVCWF